jgi:deazaflavin-dependent oxidoreductase (nitroreductase family)
MMLGEEPFVYVTTTGRVSGLPREIEIWFGMVGNSIYLLAELQERAHWVQNMKRDPRVLVRIAGQRFTGRARVVDDSAEDALARELVGTKYDEGDSEFRRTALVVAIDLVAV